MTAITWPTPCNGSGSRQVLTRSNCHSPNQAEVKKADGSRVVTNDYKLSGSMIVAMVSRFQSRL
jgi:hypothetical protein